MKKFLQTTEQQACLALLIACIPLWAEPPRVVYNRDIRPILSSRCFACHGPDEEHREADLRLDDPAQAVAVLASGAQAIHPGNADMSELIARVTSSDDERRMPPKGKDQPLSPKEVDLLRQWIAEGAEYATHWALVPPRAGTIPERVDALCETRADVWVLDRLKQAGLQAGSPADRFAWIRRATLDLTGLPPTLEEAKQFVDDASADAGHRLVDRLLSAPAYGERWARVWLDLARYADSTGYASDPLRPTIWRYRDWVIESLNRNQPFDEFTVEQMAGDLIPNATTDQIVATGFHRNTMTNTEGGTDDEEYRVAAVKDRANTTLQVWMGLTLGCAQCHSHKYDPITHEEYYKLYAFFNQTADTDKPDDQPTMTAPTQRMRDEIAQIDAAIARKRGELAVPAEELAGQQKEWETSLATTAPFEPLAIERYCSSAGASLERLEDGSVRANDAVGKEDIYEVEGILQASGWTGLRLDVLADAALPLGGPGRASNGAFILSRIRVDVSSEPVDSASHEEPIRGVFVRVELPGQGKILSLAEVEVIAGGGNIAPGGSASQSSTDYGGDAARAIDGQTDGDFFAHSSVTHTAKEANPWWEVKLTAPSAIEQIRVWNRTDGASGGRLAGSVVQILDESRRVVWSSELVEAPSPSVELTPDHWRNVPILGAWATFEQPGFPVLDAVRSDSIRAKGWSTNPKYSQSQTAWFAFAEPVDLTAPARIRVRLEHRHLQPNHTIGRFRLALSRDASMQRRVGVPTDVLAILDRPAEQRSQDEQARVTAVFQQVSPLFSSIRAAIEELEKSKPIGPALPVLKELASESHRTTRVMNKGNFLDPGGIVEPSVPASLHRLSSDSKDRMALARWLVDRANPLTARVAVNRTWARLFGRGIVETEEDFGTQGDLPTHPELLDDLAVDFMDRGWDVKRTLAEIVTSATYRRGSARSASDLEKDPANRFLASFPRQRLDAETVRDQALSLAGVLSSKMLGPSVFPYQPPNLWQAAFNGSDRTWATSPGEDRLRRGLYTFWRRTIPYPSMSVFDAPSREICTLRRPNTNTPLQAFVTMNDPVFVEAGQQLGRRLASEAGPSTTARVKHGLELCLGRPADAASVDALVRLYEETLAQYRQDLSRAIEMGTEPIGSLPPGMEPAESAALSVLGSVLLNLDGVLTKG